MIYVLSGGGKLLSIIAATYPAGSICTCSDGTKTLKAKDTSGKALFNVPVGTWTVSCTDGSRTTSKTVSITTEGQVESVTLNYTLVLFNNGDDNAPVTGGWRYEHYYASEQSFTIDTNGINLRIYNNDGASGIEASTNNRIPLSNYKNLYVNVSNISNGTFYIGVSSNQSISSSNNCTASKSGTTAGTYAIDISSISDSLYIKLKIISNVSQEASMTISAVWLG